MSKRPHPDARPCHNLDGFVVKRILKNDSKSKAVHVLGKVIYTFFIFYFSYIYI